MKVLTRILFWVLLIGGGVWGLLYLTIMEPWAVPSTDPQLLTSVQPNIFADDYLILSRHNDAQVGWVVRCADPDAPGLFVLARVVARMGETVDIQKGQVRVDNRNPLAPTRCDPPKMTVRSPVSQQDVELDCSNEELGATTHQVLRGETAEKDTHTVVDANKVFLISDNRPMHLDSRDFGQLSVNTCQHVLFRLWSSQENHRFSLIW